MSELDRMKEQVAYLKYWQGIMVVTEISLVGWLISSTDTANHTLWFLAACATVMLGFGIFSLHRRIERRIDRIGEL